MIFSLLKDRGHDQLVPRLAPVMVQGCPCLVLSLALPPASPGLNAMWNLSLIQELAWMGPLGLHHNCFLPSSVSISIPLPTDHPQPYLGPGSSFTQVLWDFTLGSEGIACAGVILSSHSPSRSSLAMYSLTKG